MTAPDTPLERAAVVDDSYRYLRAQRVEGVCLACHGRVLSAEVAEALGARYPDDQAVGYRPGEVRGAISLVKSLRAGD